MQIETEILNSMIYYPEKIDDFLSKVSFKYFSKNGKEILKHILELKDKKILSLSALSAHLKSEILNSDFFQNLISSNVNVDFNYLADTFKKDYLLKAQKEIASKLLRASDNKEILDIELLAKESSIEENNFYNFSEWLDIRENQMIKPKLKTGVDFLDTCFNGGIELGQLVLISGDPEAGKTMLGLQILENMSLFNQVCFFSFEFTIDGYLNRKRLQNNFNPKNLFIINDGYDIYEIANNIKALVKKGVKLFLIDSQMRITSPAGRNMEEEESLKFSTLAKLCHSLDVTILLIIQTSKGDRHNPMGSKKGGHEASIILRIENVMDKDKPIENQRDIIVIKNKQTGKHPKDRVVFNKQSLTFSKFQKEAKREIELGDIIDDGIEVSMPISL